MNGGRASLRRDKGRPGILWDARPRFASLFRRCPCSPSCSPSPVARQRRTALADPLRTFKVLRLPGGLPRCPRALLQGDRDVCRSENDVVIPLLAKFPVQLVPGRGHRGQWRRRQPRSAAQLYYWRRRERNTNPPRPPRPLLSSLLIPQWRAASPSPAITDHVRIHIRLPPSTAPPRPRPHFRGVVGATRTAADPECLLLLLLLSPLFLASFSSRRLPYSHLPFITSRC